MGCLFAMTILIGGDAQLVPRAISALPRVPIKSNHLSGGMPALVAGIHVFPATIHERGADGRDKPGHDSAEMARRHRKLPY